MTSPSGSSRPHIDKNIIELTKFFEANRESPEQLEVLLCELNNRKKPKAIALRAEVASVLQLLQTTSNATAQTQLPLVRPIASRPGLLTPPPSSAPPRESDADEILKILRDAKRLAQEYRRLTGKPLGITGEVAEYEAARVLGIKLTPARQAGYDAVEMKDGTVRRLQIKGRCLLDNSKRSQMLGSIRIDKDWDAVLMVLLDKNFDAVAIYQAERAAVEAALSAPGSKARNERGAMAVSKFRSIGKLRWQNPTTPYSKNL
jgi:hypothetical protein